MVFCRRPVAAHTSKAHRLAASVKPQPNAASNAVYDYLNRARSIEMCSASSAEGLVYKK